MRTVFLESKIEKSAEATPQKEGKAVTVRETQEVMEAIGKIDIASMDWQDQLIYMAARLVSKRLSLRTHPQS